MTAVIGLIPTQLTSVFMLKSLEFSGRFSHLMQQKRHCSAPQKEVVQIILLIWRVDRIIMSGEPDQQAINAQRPLNVRHNRDRRAFTNERCLLAAGQLDRIARSFHEGAVSRYDDWIRHTM